MAKEKEMKFTHTAYLVGCDSRTPEGYKRLLNLRATKTLWISKDGGKYKKTNGYPSPRANWPMYRLDLDTLLTLPESK